MPFDFTAYTINKLEEQGKDASALKAEQKTFTPDAPSPVETPTVNRDSFDSSVRNAYKSRALEQQLADLNKQNANLTNLIGGLSRAQSMGASEIIGAKRKEYETQQSSLSEQISQLTAKLEAQKKANWTADRDRKKADAESLMSVFGAKKYTPEDYERLASKAQNYEVALALDENRRNKDFESTLATGGAAANSYLGYLTDTEKNTLANFVNLGQMDKAKEYLGNIKTVLTAREREEQKKAMVEGSKESPIAGAFLNTVSSFATPISYLATAGNAIKEKITGEYTPVDTNSSAFLGSQIQEDTTEGIHQSISDKLGDGTAGKVATFLADTGLSIGQFASKLPFGATGALALMASGAAGQTSYDVLQRGGSSSQAAVIGAASGIIEAVTEKIPLDNLFRLAKSGKGTLKTAITSTLKQAGVEGAEEAISEVANNVVDIVGMGGLSQFNQYIDYLKSTKGLSQSQAESEAFMQFFVKNTLQSAAGGAISGGLMAGGANIVNSISTRANVNTPVASQDNAGTQETLSATTTLETPTMQESATQSVADENTYKHPHGFLLKETPDTLYREVGADRLLSYLMPKSDTTNLDAPYGGIPGIYVAKSPEFAIGQDGNDGVMLEFDNKDVPLVYNDKKPFNTLNGEYLVDDKFSSLLKQQQYLRGNLKKISISPKLIGEVTGEEVKNNFDFAKKKAFFNNRVIPTVEALGWTKTVDAKGNLVFSKPQSVTEPVRQTVTVGAPVNATANTMPEGMGAATQGFNPYSALQNQYGTFEAKENPARVVDVPLKDTQGRNVSGTIQTAMEAQATPDALIPTLEQAVVDGDFSYDTFTDKSAQAQADSTIKYKGFQQALNDWTSEVRSGKVNKSNTALGWTLYDNAANMVSDPNATAQQKDEAAKAAVAILTDMQAHERSAAQALQAQRMLKKMSPTYQLYALQRSAQSIADELTAKYKKQYDIAIAPELVQEFISAVDSKDADAQKAVEKKIQQNIASQIPSTFGDQWNAWRYLAMLGNPRTHIRNIVGNAGFMPVRMLKNAVAASVETGAQKVGLINERSKAILTLSKTDRALISTAWSDYNNVVDAIQNGGKYDDARSAIDRERTIFGLKPAEALRTANTKALDVEDRWFSQPAYAESLASYLKANKVTAEQFSKMAAADKAKAQEYAIKEAQKATYRDHNAFSDFVARLGRNYQGDNKAMKAANVILEGVLPFKRTPANILSRVVEYSPIELVKSITYDAVQVKKGNMSATDMIDHLASGLVGTGLVGLGALLASQGLLSGGGSGDDKQDEFDELQGKQNYAITIGDKTFTLDWLAPEAVPVFVGVEIFNKLSDNSNGGSTLKDILESLSKITDPMLEMSMLQGVQDVIEGVKYSDSPLVGAISNAAFGYLTQAVPTLGGQIERSFFEDTRQTSLPNKDSGIPTGVQYMLGKTLNKVPLVDYAQTDYIDAWGRKQSTGSSPLERGIMNFLSPAYKSEIRTTDVDQELQRLYDTGATSVLPQRAESTVTINGTKINLSKEDFESYAITKGQTAYETIQNIISSKAYQNLFDDEKAAVIDRAYAYADYKAKSQEFPQYKGDKWMATVDKAKSELGMSTADYLQYAEKYGTATMSGDNIREAYRAGIKPDTYLTYYTKSQRISSDKDENGKTIDGSKRGKMLVLIDSMNISDKAKDYLYYANGYSAKTINEAPWR